MKKSTIVLIIALVLGLGIGAVIFLSRDTGITGDEWLLDQSEYVSNLSVLVDDLENVVTIYGMEQMSNEDFHAEVCLARDKLVILHAAQKEAERKAGIRTGSHSWASKRGLEDLEEIYKLFKEMLDAFDEAGDQNTPSAVIYNYLAYIDKIEDSLTGYLAACEMVKDGVGGEKQ